MTNVLVQGSYFYAIKVVPLHFTVFFQQQKEAREKGETTPELLQEQLDRLYHLDSRIKQLKSELNQ